MSLGWWLSYDTKEQPETSHFSIVQYTNNPNLQFTDFSNQKEIKVMYRLNGGSFNEFSMPLYWLSVLVVWVGKSNHPFFLVLMLFNVCFWGQRLVRKIYARAKAYFAEIEQGIELMDKQ